MKKAEYSSNSLQKTKSVHIHRVRERERGKRREEKKYMKNSRQEHRQKIQYKKNPISEALTEEVRNRYLYAQRRSERKKKKKKKKKKKVRHT